MTLEDEENGDLLMEADDGARFICARNGDHIMGIPFECDLCSFRNLNKRDPIWANARDNYTLVCIRRANLDAFWSRESSTVEGNLRRLRLDYNDASSALSVLNPLPTLGNPTMKDRVGMGMAIYTLHSSLRQGKYTTNLQWDSMRKTPTWYANAFGAGSEYSNGAVLAKDEKKLFITECPTAGWWFSRFMRGAKLRMGVIRRQNEALTVKVVLAVCELAEEDWARSSEALERKEIEEFICFMLAEFCAALRGEEVPLIVLEGLLKFWDETRSHAPPYIMLTLRGRFKGEQGLRWHCVPVVDVTASGIPVRRWYDRLVSRRVDLESRRSGWMFTRPEGGRAKYGDYDPLFRDYLARVKAKYPKLIAASTEVDDYSLRRSGRRGATTEATNRDVDQKTIELINRWRKKEAARGTEPGLPMRQVYTEVGKSLEAMLRFSRSF